MFREDKQDHSLAFLPFICYHEPALFWIMEVIFMDTDWRIPADLFQHRCEKILFWATIGLAEFHMFACSFREVLPGYSKPFFRYERWIGAAILAALVIYLFVSAVRYPGTFKRIKPLFRKLCSLEQAYMLWVFVWYVVVLAVWQLVKGREINLFRENDWWLFEQVLMSFVFFPLPRILGSERAKRLIEPKIKLVLIPHMVLWTWILWQYYHMNYITFPSGGMLQGGKWGISMSFGYNRNITGAGALIMMALCIYMIATQKKMHKLPYIFGTVIYLAILVLTNCRTSWYCALLISISSCFCAVWFGLRGSHLLLRAATGILLAVVSVLFLCWFRGELFILLDASFTRIREAASEASQTDFRMFRQPGSLEVMSVHFSSDEENQFHDSVLLPLSSEEGTAAEFARTVEDDSGTLTGRVPLYRATLDVMFSRKLIFLFGVPSTDFGAAVYGRYGIDTYYPHAHNFLLTMGVFYGVPTMIFTAVFLVSVFVRCFRVLFVNKKQMFQGFWMIPVILAALAAEDMMESFLNLSAWSMTCITFYLFAGWIVAMDKEQRETKLKVESSKTGD